MPNWHDNIAKLPAADRLRRALANRPLPGAYNQVILALNKMIRARIKAKEDPGELIRFLFRMLCESGLVLFCIGDPDLQLVANCIAETIPRDELDALSWEYDEIGIGGISPVPEAEKWFRNYLGEPPSSWIHPFAHHRDVWDRARARYRDSDLARFESVAFRSRKRISVTPFAPFEGSVVAISYDFVAPLTTSIVTLRAHTHGDSWSLSALVSPSIPMAEILLPWGYRQVWVKDLSGQSRRDYMIECVPRKH